jgi:hypothetical protein
MELRARAVPLPRAAYPKLWTFAENEVSEDTTWTPELRDRLKEEARAAEDELRAVLEDLAQPESSARERIVAWVRAHAEAR